MPESVMTDNDLAPAAPAKPDRCSLLQRALACELAGRLDCALTLIQRLRDLEHDEAAPARG
jgi:hypothetical protein